jgi:hypothetical protein
VKGLFLLISGVFGLLVGLVLRQGLAAMQAGLSSEQLILASAVSMLIFFPSLLALAMTGRWHWAVWVQAPAGLVMGLVSGYLWVALLLGLVVGAITLTAVYLLDWVQPWHLLAASLVIGVIVFQFNLSWNGLTPVSSLDLLWMFLATLSVAAGCGLLAQLIWLRQLRLGQNCSWAELRPALVPAGSVEPSSHSGPAIGDSPRVRHVQG